MSKKWFIIISVIFIILFIIGIVLIRNIAGKLDVWGAAGYSLIVFPTLFETVCIILRIYDIAH